MFLVDQVRLSLEYFILILWANDAILVSKAILALKIQIHWELDICSMSPSALIEKVICYKICSLHQFFSFVVEFFLYEIINHAIMPYGVSGN